MHKIFMVLFVFASSITMIGQGLPRKWSGLSVAPQLSYRHLAPADDSDFTEKFIKDINEKTTPFVSGRLGGFMGFRFTRNLGFEMGLQYSYHNYKFQFEPRFPDEIDPNFGFVINNGNRVYTSYAHFHQIMLPLKWVFSPSNRKINFTGSFGVSPGIFIDSHSHSILKLGDAEKVKNSSSTDIFEQRFQCDVHMSMGLSFRLPRFSVLRIEPIFQYGMVSIEKLKTERVIRTRLWSTGIQFSYIKPIL